MKSSRKLSEERSFPSTLMERGTSGRILTAAFKKASAGGVERWRERVKGNKERRQSKREMKWGRGEGGREVTRGM